MAAGPSDSQLEKSVFPNWSRHDFMEFIQTGAGVASLLVAIGTAGLGSRAISARLYPQARAVQRLYPALRDAGGALDKPLVHFRINPYKEITADKVLILQGRNKEGKTTLLRTAIPWWRRWPVLGYRGIYLNGSQASVVDTMDKWVTKQMFGTATLAGCEIPKALVEHRAKQWLLLATQAAFGHPRPKPAYVIVDQFEELLKKFPQQALEWANNLTNHHVRDQWAYVIFVVNSDAGAQTLLNLNQGPRFKKVIMEPATKEDTESSGVLVEYFKRCNSNIGLYKLARGAKVQEADLDAFVAKVVARWVDDFHVPYPLKYDRSWREVSEATMKKKLLHAVAEGLAAAVDDEGEPVHTKEGVHERVNYVKLALEDLHATQVLDSPEEVWEARLASRGAPKNTAEGLAEDIRRLLGNPMKGSAMEK